MTPTLDFPKSFATKAVRLIEQLLSKVVSQGELAVGLVPHVSESDFDPGDSLDSCGKRQIRKLARPQS
jgi:hypothetical protein